jgi:hypothetical protein
MTPTDTPITIVARLSLRDCSSGGLQLASWKMLGTVEKLEIEEYVATRGVGSGEELETSEVDELRNWPGCEVLLVMCEKTLRVTVTVVVGRGPLVFVVDRRFVVVEDEEVSSSESGSCLRSRDSNVTTTVLVGEDGAGVVKVAGGDREVVS